jgi:phosphate:Na+ symporter
MAVLSLILNMVGGLCMFLFGMKIMSDGLQKSAGDRMRKALNFMTGNRFAGILTGFVVTALVQSSSAVSVIVVSFVSAGLITLIQSIGVIFGLNIGTTLTAWIISFIGFKFKLDSLALPAIGIGFVLSILKWKHKSIGDFLVGFGFLFLGLDFLASGMDGAEKIINFENFSAIAGYRAIWIGFGIGLVFTILINSSTAAIAIIMTMTFSQMISYEMAAGMVMGANLGTTTDAPLAAIAGNIESKRTALVHVLFNVIGVLWACIFMIPLLGLVDLIMPGNPHVPELTEQGYKYVAATTHLAGLHTIFNIINTLLFLPFVNQFAKLVIFLVPDKKTEEKDGHYKFAYLSSAVADSPELNILRVEKEIRDMAGIVSSMYSLFSNFLRKLNETKNKEKAAEELCEELKNKEDYADEMRDALTNFLIECTREHLTPNSERRASNLLKAIGYLEEMSDDCYILGLLLEKNVRKDRVLRKEEMEDLVPYIEQVGEFLNLLQDQLGQNPTLQSIFHTRKLESDINKARKDLQKLSRKRIEAGRDVKTELFFIDLVRRIEKLGDYCYDISNTLFKME